uniref:Uncharacterized protein n=1 Tax=Rhizophora mucronata TaxID=61149 RepID=A0A2P2PYP3_RHIMU
MTVKPCWTHNWRFQSTCKHMDICLFGKICGL